MPIDASIPLQVKQIELPNPLAQYAQMSQIQSAQNQNALAQYQLGAAQRAEKTQNVLSEGYQQGYDPVTGKIDYPKVLNYMAQHGGGAQIPAFQEAMSKRAKETAELTRLQVEAADKKQSMIAQAWRDISGRPSDANITAHVEDIVASPLYDAAEKAAVQKRANELLAVPFDQRGSLLASTGAKPSDLRPTMTSQTLGGTTRIMQTPAFGGVSTVAPGSEGTVTVTPSALLAAQTAREGHGVTLRGQNLVDARENQKINLQIENQRRAADPAFQQSMAQARVTGEAMAKDKVLRATQLPKVLDTAEMTINEIDAMIGKRDAKGNLVKGAAPHPGFSSTVGATLLPGARFVPGRDEADFQTRFDQVKGGAFLQAFETLKGGGSITNIEGEKGTAALNRMSLAQSEKEFITAAIEFKGIVRKGVERAKKLAGGSDTPAAATGGGSAADPLGIR